MAKSTEAQKKAARKYAEKVDHLSINAPKGAKRKMQAVANGNISGYVCGLVEKDLTSRHRDIVNEARTRIKKDIEECETVAEWHAAFKMLLDDFRNEVEGERKLEEYIVEKLGQEALSKFLAHVTIPAFANDTIRNMEAMDDFFEERDNCKWIEPPDGIDDEKKEIYEKYNSPEFTAMEDYKYLSHLYTSAVLRAEQLEAAVTALLGNEAFLRLCAQGDYETDKLYEAAMASTRNPARRHRYTVDWITKRGIFAPDADNEEKGIESEGWIPAQKLPQGDSLPVAMLLADGATRVGMFISKAASGVKASWMSAHRDYSRIVIGWKPLHSDEDERQGRTPFINEAARLGISTKKENWDADVAAAVNKQAMAAIFEHEKIEFPPDKKQMEYASSLHNDMKCVIEAMGRSGACRKEQIWRLASELMEDGDRPIDDTLKETCFELASAGGLTKKATEEGLLVLTDAGKVMFADYFLENAKNAPFVVDDMIDPDEALRQGAIEWMEKLLVRTGYSIPWDNEEDRFPCDILAEKDGEEFAIRMAVRDEARENDQFLLAQTDIPRLFIPIRKSPEWEGDVLFWGARNIEQALNQDSDAILKQIRKGTKK